MPAVSLSCRVCATEHPLVANGSCSRAGDTILFDGVGVGE